MIALLAGLALAGPWATRTAPSMGTRIDVTLPEGEIERAELVFDAFREVETTANEWRPESALGRLNAADGAPVELPPDTAMLLRTSLELAAVTGGAFDPTWAAMWGLWDFQAESPRVPDPARIEAARARVDWRRVTLQGDTATLTQGAVVGLGAVAKGWALDRAAERLHSAGSHNFTLSAGGQIYAAGQRDGRAWRVGIRDPRGALDDSIAVAAVQDQSVSTSGDYERFFIVDGVRYHHILDPQTGRPARGLRSATVVGPRSTWCDALSTAVMVLGAVDGLALIDGLDGYEVFVVDAAGEVSHSSSFPLFPP